MPIDQAVFRNAMGRMASGVTVVTTHYQGEDHGFTATSFTSLSLDPMLVLVCVIKEQRSHLMIEQAGAFAVNILGTHQLHLGMRFADPVILDRFEGLALERADTGAPLLADSIAWVDCRLRDVIPGGDHSIFIGEVLAGFASEGADALVYHNRQWGRFSSDP